MLFSFVFLSICKYMNYFMFFFLGGGGGGGGEGGGET